MYKRQHIVVLPSYREGLPKVLVEASACGRAVVTTDVPGCRDAIQADVTGLLVPVRDSAALADAIPVSYTHLVSEKQWSNFKFIQGDIRNLDDCNNACAGVDYVLHQAALGSVPRSINDPITSNATNIDGFLNLSLIHIFLQGLWPGFAAGRLRAFEQGGGRCAQPRAPAVQCQ